MLIKFKYRNRTLCELICVNVNKMIRELASEYGIDEDEIVVCW